MQEFTKLELEVKNQQGITKRFTCDMTTEWIQKGGKTIPIGCPWLVDFDSSYETLDDFTGYRGTFEVVHYNFIEGCSADGDIESSDYEILATWQFLVDGKPANYEDLQVFPRFTVS